MTNLLSELESALKQQGWQTSRAGGLLMAEKEVIQSRWLLGSRRVRHRLRLEADSSRRELTLVEQAVECSVGLVPPFSSLSSHVQRGWRFNEARQDAGVGGGSLDYGGPREWAERACRQAGWSFRSLPG
ncbi:hypothetical protein [Sulfuritortus calidifontis]|uniref:hypothetical protein n=1 Tax=Sulfuritortus calidifontis TaxID=1914471 RepID=UPI000F82BB10|nr:hypothetical protein [Sulfuritortus calidifontis]